MIAAAYIRRSHAGEAEVSETAQRETVARLAERNGDSLGEVFRDWGKSGISKPPELAGDTLEEMLPHRRDMLRLLADVRAGRVSRVYVYDQDRLARDEVVLGIIVHRVFRRHGVRAWDTAGELTDPDRRLYVSMRGVMDAGEGQKQTRRNDATNRTRRERGDHLGVAPFGYTLRTPRKDGTARVELVRDPSEDIAHVLDAYTRAGTYLGAANILNAEGFPSKRGGSWYPVTIRGIVLREAPELAAEPTRGKRKGHRPRLLAGLMRCGGTLPDGSRCEGPMSPGTAHGLLYYCGRGQRGAHGKPWRIAESRLMPWIKAEADRLRPAYDILERPGEGEWSDPKRLAAIAAARASGDDDIADTLQARYDAEAAKHSRHRAILEAIPPRIDWQAWQAAPDSEPWSTAGVNAVLTALWARVKLGSDLLPVEATWSVPEWRS